MKMLQYQVNGSLAPGIHWMTEEEIFKEFAYNARRRGLTIGLLSMARDLRSCGGELLYVDGSYTTKKELPDDFDACWDHTGVDKNKLKNDFPVFFNFDLERHFQKQQYGGEFFLSTAWAQLNPLRTFFEFFQLDRDDQAKGIVGLNLKELI